MKEEYSLKDNLYTFKTNKYKTINIYLKFACPYDLKKRLSLCLLTYFIGDYSNAYNSKLLMTKAKDNLYGPNIYSQVRTNGNLLLYTIKYNFLNPKFINDLNEDDFIDFFKECFNNVYFSEDLLKEFKRNYKDVISRRLDNPSNLASNRVAQIIAKEFKDFEVYDSDHINEIDSITLDDIKEVYNDLLKTFSLDIFLVGDYDDKLVNFLSEYKTNNNYYLNNNPADIKDLKEIVEDKNVSQSSLNVIYKTPFNRHHKDFYAYVLGNCVLGGVPTSLLFDEVREKLSLCYYISVMDFKNEGLVKIYTAIDGKNKDTVLKQIDIQINRLINKDYDLEKIDLARTLLIDAIHATVDDLDAFINDIYGRKLNQIECSNDQYIENLLKVDADDISRVFKEYKHVLTYMLNGVKHEEDL